MTVLLCIGALVAAYVAGIFSHKWAAGEYAKVDAALNAAKADIKSKL